MKARLVSLNVGTPKPLPHGEVTVASAIVKRPVTGPLRLEPEGLVGDEQADRKNHGGVDKALCVYALEHYPHWAARLGRELPHASFGENISAEGLLEHEVCIGDVYRIGTATVQVSQPRQPCFKLATRHGAPKLAIWVQESGWTGFYFRVLEPGELQAGEAVSLLDRPAHGITVSEANRAMYGGDGEAAARMLELPELSASWRRTFERRLAGR